ncbi:MAG: methyltransferase domain-containing protein [Bacteroidales bacterium]|nr:methyltransferase domain-containing protein [Bacteroidales bacterium]
MEEKTLKREFSENKVKDSYAKVAWFYDFWALLTESKAARKVIELASIKDGESILEVAVGTGQLLKELLKRNPNGTNTGTELSPGMLSRAKKRVSKLGLDNYTLETGNAYRLPFEDNSFDLLVNNFMLDLLPEEDFEKVLSEFYRVLKPSGRLVTSTMAFGQRWYNKFWHWVAKRFPGLLTGCRPVSIVSYLEKVGFSVEEVQQLSQNTFPAEVIRAMKPDEKYSFVVRH